MESKFRTATDNHEIATGRDKDLAVLVRLSPSFTLSTAAHRTLVYCFTRVVFHRYQQHTPVEVKERMAASGYYSGGPQQQGGCE